MHTVIRFTTLSLSLALGAAVVGCGSSNFGSSNKKSSAVKAKTDAKATAKGNSDAGPKGEGNAGPESGTPAPGAAQTETASSLVDAQKEFDATAAAIPVDIVWVIDSSGSMAEEIKKTRENMIRFVNSLQTSRDVESHMLAADGDLRLDLDAAVTSKVKQIRQVVGSTDALALLAAGVCAENDSNSRDNRLCGHKFDLSSVRHIDGVRGKVGKVLRDASRKVFVVVTDDDTRGVTAPDFLKALEGKVKGGYSLFAFRGFSSTTNCKIAKAGLSYKTVSEATGGKEYDICKPDWTPHFDSLLASVVALSSDAFSLAGTGVVAVKSVTVGGVPLAADKYVVSGDTITVNQDVLKAAVGAKIVITYSKPK